ncbi:MAG: cytochrome c-type biogenesis protein [Janthinobacterium lividum]
MRRRGRSGTLFAPVALLSLLALASPVRAVEPEEVLSDPVLESRARAISEGLRCLVCQNQSIDDSAAPLARDLRLIVREHLQSGDSDDAIRAYLVRRYGDFVLLKPPFERSTLLLWGTPTLVVLFGGLALLRRRRTAEVSVPLTAEEQARVDALMADTHG